MKLYIDTIRKGKLEHPYETFIRKLRKKELLPPEGEFNERPNTNILYEMNEIKKK